MARALFQTFDQVIAQSAPDASRLADLGAVNPVNGGNIKFAGQQLPAGETEVAAWRDAFAGRPVWFAANTHPGEEEECGDYFFHNYTVLIVRTPFKAFWAFKFSPGNYLI